MDGEGWGSVRKVGGIAGTIRWLWRRWRLRLRPGKPRIIGSGIESFKPVGLSSFIVTALHETVKSTQETNPLTAGERHLFRSFRDARAFETGTTPQRRVFVLSGQEVIGKNQLHQLPHKVNTTYFAVFGGNNQRFTGSARTSSILRCCKSSENVPFCGEGPPGTPTHSEEGGSSTLASIQPTKLGTITN